MAAKEALDRAGSYITSILAQLRLTCLRLISLPLAWVSFVADRFIWAPQHGNAVNMGKCHQGQQGEGAPGSVATPSAGNVDGVGQQQEGGVDLGSVAAPSAGYVDRVGQQQEGGQDLGSVDVPSAEVKVDPDLVNARLEAKQEAKLKKAMNYKIESSRAVRRDAEEGPHAVAFISNLSPQATPDGLAQFLTSLLPPNSGPDPIVKIHYPSKKSEMEGASKKKIWAHVVFANATSLTFLLDVSDTKRLEHMGRRLTVKTRLGKAPPAEGKGPTRRKLSSSQFQVAELDVGHQPLHDGSMESCYHTSDKVFLELNAPKRELALEFKSKSMRVVLRVAVPMKQISVAKLHEGRGGCHELVITSRQPPFLYRACEAKDGSTARKDLAVSSNSLSVLDHENRASDARWERTIDPTGGSNAFGTHLTYRLIMSDKIGSPINKQLVTALHDFKVHMQGGVNLPRGVSIRCSTPDPTSLRDWSGGFSQILRHLPFKHRYLIHALIASHQIIIRSPEEACCLAAATVQWLCDDDKALLKGCRLFSSYVKRCGRSISEAEIRRVFVTPLRICPQPPKSDDGKRIIRENAVHRDRFIRVTFVDENFSSARTFTSSIDVMDGRISKIVHEGSWKEILLPGLLQQPAEGTKCVVLRCTPR
eukprot:gene10044-7936_t